MAFKDGDFISKERHELDYVLRTWNRRATQANRDTLIRALDSFNGDPSLAPHKREQFYAYADSTGLKAKLEAKEGAEAKALAAAATTDEESQASRTRKFPWWWILVAILLIVLVIVLLRACGGCGASSPGTTSSQAAPTEAAEAQAPAAAASPQQAAPASRRFSLGDLPTASLAIRFRPNATDELVAGEEAKLQALILALRAFDEGELIVTGHAAGIGYPKGEMAVSEGRAAYIAGRLALSGLAAGMKISSSARGAASPLRDMASSRRVEISAR
jgi:outer membrane protein OmpA-like peptidoglycan-associated protein